MSTIQKSTIALKQLLSSYCCAPRSVTMVVDRQLGSALNAYLSLMASHPPLGNWHLRVMSDDFTLTSFLSSQGVLTLVKETEPGQWCMAIILVLRAELRTVPWVSGQPYLWVHSKTLCHEKIKSNYDCLTCSVSIKFSSYVYNWNDLNSIGKGQSAMDVKQPGISSYSGTSSPIKVRQGIPGGVESSKSS